jgi:hypothetical protein
MRTSAGHARSSVASCVVGLVVLALCLGVSAEAHAWTLQAPAGGDFFELPDDAVLCGAAPEAFVVDATRKRLRPRAEAKPGDTAVIRVAQQQSACAGGVEATLVVTDEHPVFDTGSVVLAADAGRIEVRGERLEGVRVGYVVGDKVGSDLCLNVTQDKERDVCTVNVARGLPADPRRVSIVWAPREGSIRADMILFDATGRKLGTDKAQLPIGRILLQRVFPASRMVDLASGEGRVRLEHPEAIASADCGTARCEASSDGVLVGLVPAAAQSLTVRVKLQPRVFLARGDALDSVVTETLSVLRCPLTVASGPALREVDDMRVLLRMDQTCASNADRLRWTVNGDNTEAERVETHPEGVYVLLFIGRVASDRVTIVASRPEDASVVAVTTEATVEIPPPSTSLTLPEFGEIDFIPKNRDAFLSVSFAEGPGKLVPVAIPGAYTVKETDKGFFIRGVQASSGFTSLRFSYRSTLVPAAFSGMDLGHVSDPVQRPIRQANVPAPIGAASITDRPVVELFCAEEKNKLSFIASGTVRHVPFPQRAAPRSHGHGDHGRRCRARRSASVATAALAPWQRRKRGLDPWCERAVRSHRHSHQPRDRRIALRARVAAPVELAELPVDNRHRGRELSLLRHGGNTRGPVSLLRRPRRSRHRSVVAQLRRALAPHLARRRRTRGLDRTRSRRDGHGPRHRSRAAAGRGDGRRYRYPARQSEPTCTGRHQHPRLALVHGRLAHGAIAQRDG